MGRVATGESVWLMSSGVCNSGGGGGGPSHSDINFVSWNFVQRVSLLSYPCYLFYNSSFVRCSASTCFILVQLIM